MPEGRVTDYDEELNGIIEGDRGIRISIPGVLVGEEIRYHLEHVSPHQPRAWGRCDALLKPSPQRISAPCQLSWPSCGPCPGCPLMHISADHQEEIKRQLVMRSLSQAGITYIRDLEYYRAPEDLHYRNRTDLVACEIRGKFSLGAYRNHSHDVFSIRSCMVLRPPQNQVISFITGAARRLGIPAARQGVQLGGAIRYVSLFANDQGRVLVDLVCKTATGARPQWLDRFASELKSFKAIAGVSWSPNDSPNNAIRVAPSTVLWGVSRLPESHGQVVSQFSASGFTQLNTDVAARVYATARDWLDTRPNIAWDLYCGAGAFGRMIAPVRALYGAEFNAPAIEAARRASAGDAFETHFEVMDLEKSWPSHWPEPNLILLDPPRKGLSRLMIERLPGLHTSGLLYMSCNPVTFAQNIAALSGTYVLQRIAAFDMMPQTRHVEVLGLLLRR